MDQEWLILWVYCQKVFASLNHLRCPMEVFWEEIEGKDEKLKAYSNVDDRIFNLEKHIKKLERKLKKNLKRKLI